MVRWKDVNGIYQIYPRSFKDTNGDGVGDLAGIIEKLDYIKGGDVSLGIDAIWISPFYRSPMVDFGYDVADYYSVDPLFGDLEEFKVLLNEAHRRDIKVMVDYVPNHTSSQHPWFVASKSSRTNEKRDWYVWRNPRPDGSPPNNWLSVFGGSAWELDEASGQYYLHSFLAAQPDLNWDNPEVREAMTDVLRFWLSLGVDGIRADAVRWLSKDPDFRDNLPNPDYKPGQDPYHSQLEHYSRYGDKLFDYLKEIASVVEEYPDRIILFEDYPDRHFSAAKQYKAMYSVNPAVAAPFNFQGMKTPYSARAFEKFIDTFQELMKGELRPFYCFSNHDKPRLASRVGAAQARLIGLLQLTLPGIPVVYYGDELGMHDVLITDGAIRDPFELQVPGYNVGRDPSRTPMQWTGEPLGGFSSSTPWLPLADDIDRVNVVYEASDPASFFTMYKTLLLLRRSPAIKDGTYSDWDGSNDEIFGYIRRYESEALLVLLNMSEKSVDCVHEVSGEIIFSTHPLVESDVDEHISLKPHQGVVIRQAKKS